jgi:hypothetical protein
VVYSLRLGTHYVGDLCHPGTKGNGAQKLMENCEAICNEMEDETRCLKNKRCIARALC